jgi:hypothetical protein
MSDFLRGAVGQFDEMRGDSDDNAAYAAYASRLDHQRTGDAQRHCRGLGVRILTCRRLENS